MIWNLHRPDPARPAPSARAPPHAVALAQNELVQSFSPVGAGSLRRGSELLSSQLLGSDASYMRPPQPRRRSYAASTSNAVEYLFDAHTRAITDINWSPFHPDLVASCSLDSWAWVWDLRLAGQNGGRPAQGFSAWNAGMSQVKWNRVTLHRIAASCDNKVLVWDDRFGAVPLATLEAHHSKVYGLDWSPDHEYGRDQLLTCSLDGTVKYWDLGSQSSRSALARRARITESSSTIETPQPVWRARYLPFGNGVMSVAQRGDASPSMYRYGTDVPVHRFVGHTDTVREFLFRSQGGADAAYDDRAFQLITWSKDQTLRLWPIHADLLRAVGHQRVPRSQLVAGRQAAMVHPDAVAIPRHATPPASGTTGASAHSKPVPLARPRSLQTSATVLSGSSTTPERALARSLPVPRVLGTTPTRRRAPVADAPAATGPQMRYTQEDPNLLAVDAVQWMAHVRVGRTVASTSEHDGSLSESLQSSPSAADPSALPRELLRVSYQYPYVIESVDIARRRCTVATSGPWHDQGAGALAYLRVMFTFPMAYPHEPPAIEIERNASIPFKTRAELYRALVDLIEEKGAQHTECLEACVAFLVQGGHATPDAALTPMPSTPQPRTQDDSPFVYSYQMVADAVLQLTLQSADPSRATSDVVLLFSMNPLARTNQTSAASAARRADSIGH